MALKRGQRAVAPQAVDSGEDEFYSSENDEFDDQIDTDDEDYGVPASDKQSKRLKTFHSNDDLFHNKSPADMKAIERLPTRRPNPKISNRNALMARENRRKKKEYMENLEKGVEDTQNENKKLRKLLRARNQSIAKLTQESLYLRSVLANKTEILSLLKTIQVNRTPITSSTKNFVCEDNYQCNEISSNKRGSASPHSMGSSTPSTSSGSSCSDKKYLGTDLGTISGDEVLALLNDPFILSADDLQSMTSSDSLAPSAALGNDNGRFDWEDFLSDPTLNSAPAESPLNIQDLRDVDDSEIMSNHSHVNSEHNYYNSVVGDALDGDVSKPGICLHISSGKVSLEFCATCHLNSQNAWIEEM